MKCIEVAQDSQSDKTVIMRVSDQEAHEIVSTVVGSRYIPRSIWKEAGRPKKAVVETPKEQA